MKKLLSIGLLILYIPFSTGLLVSYRYCNGSLDGIALLKSVENCCSTDELEKECCKHFSTLAKINSAYDNTSPTITFKHGSDGIVIDLPGEQQYPGDGLKKPVAYNKQLSVIRYKTPIYLTNRVLII
ncbi:MAG TPA: hypothetical protein PLV21_03735 [Cyclobacteriaceae bacterium]|nr:hypothetical protein [Cyclobacteriaceae bacterium]HRJ80970.1 hypothetical protein [Cyclobacteriaceae bacterium]